MMTAEEQKRLRNLEKRVWKLKKKGMKIIHEIQDDDQYHGFLEDCSETQFKTSIKYMLKSIDSKFEMDRRFDAIDKEYEKS